MFIKAKMNVTTLDRQRGYPVGAQIAPINNLLHVLFSKVDLTLNGIVVGSSEHHYGHEAHLVTLFNFASDTKKCELTGSFWHEDTPGEFETLDYANTGFVIRRNLGIAE